MSEILNDKLIEKKRLQELEGSSCSDLFWLRFSAFVWN